MLKNRKTDTTIFLLPVLACNKQELELCAFEDSYIECNDPDIAFEDSIFLLFKPLNKDIIDDFYLRENERTDVLKKDYENLTVFVYRIPDQFVEDKELVIRGLYSKTSQQFQNMFTKYKKKGSKVIPTLQHLVFTKDEGLREQWSERVDSDLPEDSEVWGTFNIEDNTLKLKI